MNPNMFQDESEMHLHEEAIARLCEEFPGKCELISREYLVNLEPLLEDASIRTYLPIFVSRKVKDGLLQNH